MIAEIIGVAFLVAVTALSVVAVVRGRRRQRRYDDILVEVLKVGNSALLMAVTTAIAWRKEYDRAMGILEDLDACLDFEEPLSYYNVHPWPSERARLNSVFARARELLQGVESGDVRTDP
jgi:hypothetical protein